MLEIVCGQRDRFKIRLAEMEQENDRVTKQLEIAKAELASYRQDNVKLYEKIRYLQSFNESRAGRGYPNLFFSMLHFINFNYRSSDIERGENKGPRVSDDLENKYGKLYEDTVVNPFAIFNRKERSLSIYYCHYFFVLIIGQVSKVSRAKSCRKSDSQHQPIFPILQGSSTVLVFLFSTAAPLSHGHPLQTCL
jgi:hypothetical protein